MSRTTYILLAIAGVVGILGGGILGNHLRGQPINWFLIVLNVALVGGIFYLASHKKNTEVEKEKISWAERKERKKRKQRK